MAKNTKSTQTSSSSTFKVIRKKCVRSFWCI